MNVSPALIDHLSNVREHLDAILLDCDKPLPADVLVEVRLICAEHRAICDILFAEAPIDEMTTEALASPFDALEVHIDRAISLVSEMQVILTEPLNDIVYCVDCGSAVVVGANHVCIMTDAEAAALIEPLEDIVPPSVDGYAPHPCLYHGCEGSVAYDDEPYCFTHSPDSGSSVRGYSYRANVALATKQQDDGDAFVAF